MTSAPERMLLTGGTGVLGRELRGLLPGIVAPPRRELDITHAASIGTALDRYHPAIVIHAAAYTDVARAEWERELCWTTNVVGTRQLVQELLGRDMLLVHISTDYVFEGTRGGYAEDDPPGPPRNYYALTKLVAEEVARLAPRHLIIRTSFRPRVWPYPAAFTDLYTCQDYVDVIAPLIALAIQRCEQITHSVLHIGTERKSVYELAKRRSPHVQPASKVAAGVALPDDISLDLSRWEDLLREWQTAPQPDTAPLAS